MATALDATAIWIWIFGYLDLATKLRQLTTVSLLY